MISMPCAGFPVSFVLGFFNSLQVWCLIFFGLSQACIHAGYDTRWAWVQVGEQMLMLHIYAGRLGILSEDESNVKVHESMVPQDVEKKRKA